MSEETDYLYHVHTIDLTVAHPNSQFSCGLMTTLLVRKVDDTNSLLTIRFGSTAAEAVQLRAGDTYNFKNMQDPGKPVYFRKVFFTNIAVGAGSAELVFSRNIDIQRLLRITADVVQEGLLQQVVNVGAVAAALIPAAALQGRINICVYNPAGGITVYLGSATVTAAGATQGLPLLPGGTFQTNLSEMVPLYGIVAAGAQNVNVLEGS